MYSGGFVSKASQIFGGPKTKPGFKLTPFITYKILKKSTAGENF